MKWLNSAAPLLAMLVLVTACIVAHDAGFNHLEFLGNSLPATTPTAAARLRFIGYIDAHAWLVFPYLAAWIVALLWLQMRKSPNWCLFSTFTLLALPLFGYMWICWRVATTS
jgi:hypothetical protein